jgi:hypothetical protein
VVADKIRAAQTWYAVTRVTPIRDKAVPLYALLVVVDGTPHAYRWHYSYAEWERMKRYAITKEHKDMKALFPELES